MSNRLHYIILLFTLCCAIDATFSKAVDNMPAFMQKKSFVEQNGRLSVWGTSLVNEKGEDVMLKGVSLGWHNWWPRFYDKNTIAWLNSDWQCNLVRAAIGVEPDGAFLTNPDLAYKKLYTVVDAAIKNGMYVIVDWHSHHIHKQEAEAFFQKVVTKYKGVPNLLYEIYNEPEKDSWEDVKAYSESVIQTIRNIDSSAIILVGSPHWCQDIHLVADNPILEHTNIMYTLHFYAATHKQYLRDRADYALGKGIPIFVSECAGMEATGDGKLDIAEWNAWQQWMRENKLSWVAWSLSDKNETCSMVLDNTSPHYKWSATQLKPWGTLIRNTLKNLN